MSKKLNLLARLYFFKFRISKKDSVERKGVHKYLSIEVKSGTLNHKQLKYLYKNIYNKSDNVLESLIPVSQAMIKGIPINEIEDIVSQIPYNNSVTDSNDNSELYCKRYKDLKFIFDKYITYKNQNLSQVFIHISISKYIFALKLAYNSGVPQEQIYNFAEQIVKRPRKSPDDKRIHKIKTTHNKIAYKVRISPNKTMCFSSYKDAKNYVKHYQITKMMLDLPKKSESDYDKDLEI